MRWRIVEEHGHFCVFYDDRADSLYEPSEHALVHSSFNNFVVDDAIRIMVADGGDEGDVPAA